jgi:hypothetical protein
LGAFERVANSDLDPGCEQSFGLVHILPGKINPEYWHTAAEEIVYMLQGECDVRLGASAKGLVRRSQNVNSAHRPRPAYYSMARPAASLIEPNPSRMSKRINLPVILVPPLQWLSHSSSASRVVRPFV